MENEGFIRAVKPQSMPERKYYLYIPVLSSLYFQYDNNSFAYHDLIKRRTDDSLVFRLDNVLSKMKKNNYIGINASTTLAGFGIRLEDNYYELTITERFEFGFKYPKELINLIDKGNGPYIGQTLQFKNTSFDLTHFREYSFGYSRKMNDRFTAGINFKILYGLENLSTTNKTIRFTTSAEDYSLQLNNDVTINTSSYNNSPNGYKDYKPGKYLLGGLHNKGIGFDFGVRYTVNEKWLVNFSVIDLGFINWKANVINYQTEKGYYAFSGVDLSDFVNDTTRNVQSILDSLSNSYKTKESHANYTTQLHSKIFLSAKHQLSDKTALTGTAYLPFFNGYIHPAIGITADQKLSSKTTLLISYSYQNRTFDNLGTGIQINTGSFHAFMVTDNLFGFLFPASFRTVGARLGMTFNWN